VLDVACGTGVNFTRLRTAHRPGRKLRLAEPEPRGREPHVEVVEASLEPATADVTGVDRARELTLELLDVSARLGSFTLPAGTGFCPGRR
jgi:hypothetical protein